MAEKPVEFPIGKHVGEKGRDLFLKVLVDRRLHGALCRILLFHVGEKLRDLLYTCVLHCSSMLQTFS